MISRWYAAWRVVYTLLTGAFGLMIALEPSEIGNEPGYWILLFATLPSVVLLTLGLKNKMLAYKALRIYGLIIAVITIVFAITAPNFMWLIVWFPMLAYPVEAVLIHISVRT